MVLIDNIGGNGEQIFLERLTKDGERYDATAASTKKMGAVDAASGRDRVVDIEDVPPNGGYGWVCTLCVFLINAHTWGVNSVG
jgi:hypothetical protein